MYNALIRTHHITSRKKVATLKAATKKLQCYALLRSGGIPGIMYIQGEKQESVQSWIDTVHSLRYKDYQLASAVFATKECLPGQPGELEEVETVKEVGALMEQHGLTKWWRLAMGFVQA